MELKKTKKWLGFFTSALVVAGWFGRLFGRRKVSPEILEGFKYYLEYFQQEFVGRSSYTPSFSRVCRELGGSINLSAAESEIVERDFREVENEVYQLQRDFARVVKRRSGEEFNSTLRRFNRLIGNTSTRVKTVVRLVRKAESEGKEVSLPGDLAFRYQATREDYNHFIRHYAKFLKDCSCYHNCLLEPHRVKDDLVLYDQL